MLPSLSCTKSEHPTRQNTWVCLTLFSSYLTSSCRPANWERELALHFRQPDVLPDGGQRSRGFRIFSRKSPHYRSTRWKKEAVTLLLVNSLSSTIVPPAGGQRSGKGQNKLPSILHYRSTRR